MKIIISETGYSDLRNNKYEVKFKREFGGHNRERT